MQINLWILATWGWGALTLPPSDFPQFGSQTIDPFAGEICYAVTLADVNDDRLTDIVVVTERSVWWYENPSWEKHAIIDGLTERDNVCIAAHDIDGDGKTDFALGAGWTRSGTIQWLTRSASLDEPWRVHPIGQEPWLHRMRFADVLGTGTRQLVISPLNKTQAGGVRLLALEIPANPQTGRWKPTVLNASFNRMHNHWHDDVDGDSQIDTLTASQEGIHLVHQTEGKWTQTLIHRGNAAGGTIETRGAGEIKVGRFENGAKFITTIEPMHGNEVVVYSQTGSAGPEPAGGWRRAVIDDSLKRGHALWVADLDGDGGDEIIAGHSDAAAGPIQGPGLYVYDAKASGDPWNKHVLDNGGIATEDAVAGDLNGDGRVDVVAVGRATHNVKLYLNLGAKAP